MANYTKTTDFEVKDALPSGDPGKIIKGTEFEVEFDAISASIATKADQAGPTFTGTATFGDLNVTGSFTSLGIDDNGTTAAITIDATNDVAITNGLTVDGTTLVVDDTNNNVGIGTASPGQKLDVSASTGTLSVSSTATGTSSRLFLFNTTDNLYGEIGNDGSDLIFKPQGAERMRITSSGNVGIGTSSPTAKAHILSAGTPITPNAALDDLVVQDTSGNSGVTVASSAASFGYYGFADTASSYTGGMFYDHSADSLGFNANSGVRMTIDSSGNVGIGTDTPSRKLHVEDSVGTVAQFTSTGTAGGGIALADGNSASANNQRIRAEGDDLTFTTSGSESLRIDASGNVGIGTTTPTGLLDLNSAGDVFLNFIKGNAPQGSLIGSGNVLFIDGGDSGVRFRTGITTGAATERLRIDASGNLLVGTTTAQGKITTAANGTFSNGSISTYQYTLSGGYGGLGGDATGMYLQGFAGNPIYINEQGNAVYSKGISSITTATAANVHVDGTTGQLRRSTSSLRYKDNVEDMTYGLDAVMALRPVTYAGKEDGDRRFGGFIAEEVDAAGLTEFVEYDEEGRPDALMYSQMVSVMAKAIQELKAEVEALKNA